MNTQQKTNNTNLGSFARKRRIYFTSSFERKFSSFNGM